MANFYCHFVPQFAHIRSWPPQCTHKQKCREGTHQQAFDTLKHALVSPPVLDYPTKHDTFMLTSDTSDTGIGAVLSTARGTVIEYCSGALTKAELSYSTTENECLAIVWATHKLWHYLMGAHFVIEIDHKPLKWLQLKWSSHARSQKLEWWSLQLRGFDFSVKYHQESCNQHANALFREPVTMVAISTELDTNVIAAAQQSDPVLSIVFPQMTSKETPSSTNNWWKFSFKRYQQICSQLTMHDSVLCRRVKTPTVQEEKLLLIVPKSP